MGRQSRSGSSGVASAAAASIAFALLLAPQGQLHAAVVWSVTGSVFLVSDGVTGKALVRAGQSLEEGDVLTGETKDAAVLIQCNKEGDAHALSGEFEAVIISASDNGQCVIDLKAGLAVATKAPTGPDRTILRAGPIAMASIHTQFGIQVTPARDAAGVPPSTHTFVLDGAAVCRDSRRPDKTWLLKSGEQFDPNNGARASIDDRIYEQLARAFARLDAAPVKPPEPALEDKLTAAWLAVLRKPNDAPARAELARLQSFSQSAIARYQQARAKELASQSGN
jgi:hypothetical protein